MSAMIDHALPGSAAGPGSFALAAIQLTAAYALALWIAYVLAWYLPFKFASESDLFSILEAWAGREWVEPYFRYFTGCLEGVTIVLLLVPGLQVLGAGIALVTMATAIALHLVTPLGIDPYGDGGVLFAQACANLAAAAVILGLRRREILPLARVFLTDPLAVRACGVGRC
jgi:hypothetical protein